jgi:hypothetical protein
MRLVGLLLAVLAVAVAVACETTRADQGRDAMLQVEGAQFYRSAMPADESGPKVLSATLAGRAQAGLSEQPCSGELERTASAVAVGLASDVGYWIVPAGIPSASAPTTPTFELVFGVASTLAPGPHEVVFRAVDGAGRFGPRTVRPLEITPRLHASGRLVISLSWDNQADLDLHVLLPTGVEIFKRNPTEYQRPPPSAGPVAPNAPTDGGVLDHDSNARCVFDGQRAENVVWTEAPPAGHYVVRVDTFSLCGAPSARWQVEAILDGVRIGAARGTSTDDDLRFDHNRGAGVLALELDVK